jgi:hypothetical protein
VKSSRFRSSFFILKSKLALLAAAVVLGLAVIPSWEYAYAGGGISITRAFQPSSSDTYVDEKNPGTSYGSATTMDVRRKNKAARRSLVTFDISQVPSGSTISSATLSLWATSSANPALGQVDWTVTSDVSALRGGTAYGWIIISQNESNGNETTTYRTRENATAGERLRLSITLPPGTPTRTRGALP